MPIPREVFAVLQKLVLPQARAHFNVVNICNANCVFCAYQYREDENMVMSNRMFAAFVEQYSDLQPNSAISLTPTVGDPLVDKDVFKKVRIARKLGIKHVQFYTNAILLKRRIDEVLAAPLDSFEISFPDFDKQEYETLYRVPRYGQVLAGIHSLLKTLKERGSTMPVTINLRHRRPLEAVFGAPDYKMFIEPYLTRHVNFATNQYDDWNGMIKQEDLPEGMKLRPPVTEPLPCRRLFDLQFLPTGDVRICGCRFRTSVFDDLVVGNINKNTLEDIWFSDKVFEMRLKFYDGEVPSGCQGCSLKAVNFNLIEAKRRKLGQPGSVEVEPLSPWRFSRLGLGGAPTDVEVRAEKEAQA